MGGRGDGVVEVATPTPHWVGGMGTARLRARGGGGGSHTGDSVLINLRAGS